MNNYTLNLLNKRDLEKSFFLIYCVPAQIYVEESINYVNKHTLYVFFGLTLEGNRRYITSMLDKEVPKTSDWYNIFQEIKQRKLEHIIFGLLPDIKQLRDAIKLAYPEIEIYDSCDKTIGKLKKYNSYKTKDEIYREVRKLYVAKDEIEYNINYEGFIEKYKEYPFIINGFMSSF